MLWMDVGEKKFSETRGNMSRSSDWNQKETEKFLSTINEFELISERTVLYSYICDVASFYAQTVQ